MNIYLKVISSGDQWLYEYSIRSVKYQYSIPKHCDKISVPLVKAYIIALFNIFRKHKSQITFHLNDKAIASIREEFLRNSSFLTGYCYSEFTKRKCHFENIQMISSA